MEIEPRRRGTSGVTVTAAPAESHRAVDDRRVIQSSIARSTFAPGRSRDSHDVADETQHETPGESRPQQYGVSAHGDFEALVSDKVFYCARSLKMALRERAARA